MFLRIQYTVKLHLLGFILLMLLACSKSDSSLPDTLAADSKKPSVLSTLPIHKSTNSTVQLISITFSEPISAVKSSNFTIRPMAGVTLGTLNIKSDQILILDPAEQDKILDTKLSDGNVTLPTDTVYLVEVQGVKDKSKNVC